MTECGSDHCLTCSDEAVPMRVRDVRPDAVAICDDGSEVMTDLLGPIAPGDVILVHAGTALSRLAERPEGVLP
jgi:hydrogenase maturation factor